MRYLFLILSFLLVSTTAHAELKKQTLEYKDAEGTVLEGYLVYDDAAQGKLPGVIVVHDWMGFGPYGNGRAEQLAQLGYAAFAVDIYGKGVRPQNQDEAGKQAGKYKGDRTLMRQRAQAGLTALLDQPMVDHDKVAAIGYCFGGTVALEMARAGMPINGAVSFHGGLSTDMPAKEGEVKAHVLALHGADDPLVPPAEVSDFQKEMNSAGVDWQMVYYSGAVHSFTRPDAGNDKSKGVAYNEKADKRSWEEMKQFFNEIFKK